MSTKQGLQTQSGPSFDHIGHHVFWVSFCQSYYIDPKHCSRVLMSSICLFFCFGYFEIRAKDVVLGLFLLLYAFGRATSLGWLNLVANPSPIHTFLCLVVSGKNKRLARGPADPLAFIPSPVARVGPMSLEVIPPSLEGGKRWQQST